MSNIQITENESGKYSPEWFYTESQTPEWIAFAHKADELRENFINLFGIERLKSLSGRNLLTAICLKWTKIFVKYSEVFLVDLHINLDSFIIKKSELDLRITIKTYTSY